MLCRTAAMKNESSMQYPNRQLMSKSQILSDHSFKPIPNQQNNTPLYDSTPVSISPIGTGNMMIFNENIKFNEPKAVNMMEDPNFSRFDSTTLKFNSLQGGSFQQENSFI